jgi:hypothetical protein
MADSLTTITLTLPAYASGVGDPRLIEANILMVTLAGRVCDHIIINPTSTNNALHRPTFGQLKFFTSSTEDRTVNVQIKN